MINRSMLGAGLAASTLAVTGCGQTVGNTVAAGKGECLPSYNRINLPSGDRMFIGEVHYGGIHEGSGITRRLQIQNTGSYILQLDHDSGELQSDSGPIEMGETLDYEVSAVAPYNAPIIYNTENSSTTLRASQGGDEHITLRFTTDCK